MAETTNETIVSGGSSPNKAIDLTQYMTNMKAEKEEVAAEEATAQTEDVTEPKKTPLEELREKQQSDGLGMAIDKETFQEHDDAKQLRNPIDSEEREEGIRERLKEEDQKLINRKAVVLVKRPNNPAEYARIEFELENLKFDEDGKPYWDLKETNASGEEVHTVPQWFVIRTPEYGEYDPKTEAMYSLGYKPEDVKAAKENGTLDKNAEGFEEPADKIEEEKKLVQILIDKTGYGGKTPIEFTEEEKKKIYEADQILLTSTKKFDIASIKINVNDENAPKRTFQAVAREHQLSDSRTTICFPMSGFHAQMSGMTYGEMRDIALNPETIGFDNVRKQISVVYDKMKNISCNAFEDLTDFMKHFAYSDFNMALYGLYVSTFPELQSVGLKCGNERCGRSFEHQFNTRTIIQFKHSSDYWLNRYKELVAASPFDYQRMVSEAPVNNINYVELPYSKYVFGIGVMTLYDYLYKMIPVNDPEELKRMFGEEVSLDMFTYLSRCMFIRNVLVPDGNGGYDQYESLEDILAIMNSLNPEECKIVCALADDIRDRSEPVIGVENVKCPYCGTRTRLLTLDVASLLFRARETLQNTTVDVSRWRPM